MTNKERFNEKYVSDTKMIKPKNQNAEKEFKYFAYKFGYEKEINRSGSSFYSFYYCYKGEEVYCLSFKSKGEKVFKGQEDCLDLIKLIEDEYEIIEYKKGDFKMGFCKSDLKQGDKVVLRNKTTFHLMEYSLCELGKTSSGDYFWGKIQYPFYNGKYSIFEYYDNLIYGYNNEDLDIVEVYRKENYNSDYELIWKREEEKHTIIFDGEERILKNNKHNLIEELLEPK